MKMGIQSDLNNNQLTAQIQRIMETHYDLGKLIRIKEIFGGFCNKSYAVWISREDTDKKLFLRLYNPGTSKRRSFYCKIRQKFL